MLNEMQVAGGVCCSATRASLRSNSQLHTTLEVLEVWLLAAVLLVKLFVYGTVCKLNSWNMSHVYSCRRRVLGAPHTVNTTTKVHRQQHASVQTQLVAKPAGNTCVLSKATCGEDKRKGLLKSGERKAAWWPPLQIPSPCNTSPLQPTCNSMFACMSVLQDLDENGDDGDDDDRNLYQ